MEIQRQNTKFMQKSSKNKKKSKTNRLHTHTHQTPSSLNAIDKRQVIQKLERYSKLIILEHPLGNYDDNKDDYNRTVEGNSNSRTTNNNNNQRQTFTRCQ